MFFAFSMWMTLSVPKILWIFSFMVVIILFILKYLRVENISGESELQYSFCFMILIKYIVETLMFESSL